MVSERGTNDPHLESNIPGSDRFCRPTRVINGWVHCSTQGQPHHTKVLVCDHVRGSTLMINDKRLAEDMGICVHHYHDDNGRFADKSFVEDCQIQCQGLTYCGVNVHFQNGIAEKKICDVQE